MVEETEPTTDDVLRALHKQTESISERYATHVNRLLEKKEEQATKEDIAELYQSVKSDQLSLLADFIAETAAGFSDIAVLLAESDDEEEDDSEDSEAMDENTIEVYSTLQANLNAFEGLMQTTGVLPQAKEAFGSLVELNRKAMKVFEDEFGEEIKQAFAETLKQAQESKEENESPAKAEEAEAASTTAN